jgi:protein-disulfide isomerase
MRKSALFIGALLLSATVAVAEPITDQNFNNALEKYLSTDSGQEKIGKTVETYFRKLQEKALKDQQAKSMEELEGQFKNPVKIDVGSSPVKGPANAKVTIIEFSDFQCPYCKRANDTMTQVLKAYPNDVRLAFKHLPLSFHPQAEKAAKATMAAMKQGKFWEMHDALFDKQADLKDGIYEEIAAQLKLDVAKFKADFASAEIEKMVKDDAELGNKNGIQGTPGFFVNGVAVKGAYPFEHFKKIIDRHLGKTETAANAKTENANG